MLSVIILIIALLYLLTGLVILFMIRLRIKKIRGLQKTLGEELVSMLDFNGSILYVVLWPAADTLLGDLKLQYEQLRERNDNQLWGD